MERFSQPITLPCSRYDKDDTEETDAFTYTCEQFNDIMECPYIQGSNLAAYCLSFIFSVIELQYEILFDHQDEDCDPLFPYVIHLKEFDSFALFSFQYGTLFAIIPISMYNGQRGNVRHKN